MGNITNLIDFSYSWLIKGKFRKELGIAFALSIVSILAISLVLYSAALSITEQINTVGSAFGGYGLGVDPYQGVLSTIFSNVPILLGIAVVYIFLSAWMSFVFINRGLLELKHKPKYLFFNADSLIGALKLFFTALLSSLFNWVEKKILLAQIISYILAILILGPSLLDPYGSSFGRGALLSIVGMLAAGVATVLLVYNSLRFYLIYSIGSFKGGLWESAKLSWNLTKNKLWETLGLISSAVAPVGLYWNYGTEILNPILGFFGSDVLTLSLFIYLILFIVLVTISIVTSSLGQAFIFSLLSREKISKLSKI